MLYVEWYPPPACGGSRTWRLCHQGSNRWRCHHECRVHQRSSVRFILLTGVSLRWGGGGCTYQVRIMRMLLLHSKNITCQKSGSPYSLYECMTVQLAWLEGLYCVYIHYNESVFARIRFHCTTLNDYSKTAWQKYSRPSILQPSIFIDFTTLIMLIIRSLDLVSKDSFLY